MYFLRLAKKGMFLKHLIFVFLFILPALKSTAQLCSGKPGIPVVLETFGAGAGLGPALPPGTTNYPYVSGWPQDGSYTVSSSSNPNDGGNINWHTGTDHTGDLNGRMMVVNANLSPSEFYRRSVTGLCPNTTYTFSSWLANVNSPAAFSGACANNYVYAKVLFNIENPDGSLAGSTSTGNIPISPTLDWVEYGLTFKTGPAQTSLNIVMVNAGPGGCGNDIVIDDVSFTICGPTAKIVANPPKTAYCIGENLNLNGTIGGGVFNTPEYQWQYSSDNITYSNIPGQKSLTMNLSPLSLVKSGNYRLLAAETGNLGSITCGIVSDTLLINVVPPPVFTVNSPTMCTGTPATLTASLSATSAATNFTWNNGGGSGASVSVSPTNTTTYTATGTDINGCVSTASGIVTVKQSPTASALPVTMCAGESRTLTAVGNAAAFNWGPAGGLNTTTGTTVIASPLSTTTYTLIGTTDGCSTTSTVKVTVLPKPTLSVLPSRELSHLQDPPFASIAAHERGMVYPVPSPMRLA